MKKRFPPPPPKRRAGSLVRKPPPLPPNRKPIRKNSLSSVEGLKKKRAVIHRKPNKSASNLKLKYNSGDKATNLLIEFIQTENEYVEHLDVFKRYVMDGLKKLKKKNSKITSEEFFDSMFGEFEVILRINLLFVKDLKKLGTVDVNVVKFCEVVINFSQCFKLYSTYMSKYFDIVKRCKKEIEKNYKFKDFINICEVYFREKKYRITDFFSYLILPIQRIPRYKLLLESLIKCLGKMKNKTAYEAETRKLKQAYKTISGIAEYCDKKQRQNKLEEKLRFLATIINVKDLIQPYRHLIEERLELQAIVKGKYNEKRQMCNIYVFNDIFVCLILEMKDIRKRTSTVALVLKKALIVKKIELTEKKNKFSQGIRITTAEDYNFNLKIFFTSQKMRDDIKELLDKQIYENEKSTIKGISQLEKKTTKKRSYSTSSLFTSGNSQSNRNTILEGFEILREQY